MTSANGPPRNQPFRIIIIDDNRMIHDDFTKILAPAVDQRAKLDALESELFGSESPALAPVSFAVSSEFQGEDGFRAVCRAYDEGAPFALAFVDMRMPPGWDGLQTITEIWKHDPDIQIVICTAYSDYSWMDIYQRVGQNDRLLILKKPFDNVEVLQLAHTLTEKWSMTRSLRRNILDLESAVEVRTSELLLSYQSLSLEAEKHLQTSRQLASVKDQLEAILRTLPTILIGVDDDGRITIWNDHAERTLGIPAARARGGSLAACGITWESQLLEGMLTQARSSGTAAEMDLRYDGPGGTGFLAVSAARMQSAAGERPQILVFATEITRRKLMESHQVQSQKLEAIGQLAAGIAHEINTPTQYVGDNIRFLQDAFLELNGLIDGYRGIFARSTPAPADATDIAAIEKKSDSGYLAAEIPKAFAQSLDGISQISKIVSAMRDFSHMESGTRSSTDLNGSIRSTLEVARNEYKYIADIELDLAEDLAPVPCHVGEINQVILNLVVNAAQAIGQTPGSRGLIRIATALVGDSVQISIADSGPGIPEAARHRIFEPFFTTKAPGKGTGQGLFLSREIVVKHHGGTLDFTCPPGGGTSFTIRLPTGKADDPTAA